MLAFLFEAFVFFVKWSIFAIFSGSEMKICGVVGSAESSQVEERDSTPQPRLQLYLKGPGITWGTNVHI